MNDITKEQLENAIVGSVSKAETLRKLGLGLTGWNYKKLSKAADDFRIDTSHWLGQAHGLTGKILRYPDSKVFVKDSSYGTSKLYPRLVARGFAEECAGCGIGDIWNGKPLQLQVDHINGDGRDHRLENLRFLCPNCHSQTGSFAGRNSRK